MARSSSATAILNLPLELSTAVCQQLDLHDLVRIAATCTRFRHGDGGLKTAELPTKSPVVTALRELAFPGGALIPSTRPVGCSESWVAYLARCARQRRCREAPPIAAGYESSQFVDAAGGLLMCGKDARVGRHPLPTSVATAAGVRVRSVAAGQFHSLALGWDGRVYSWGHNFGRQLGHGDRHGSYAPKLVEGLEGVRGVDAAGEHSLAVTQSGDVFHWGRAFPRVDSVRPIKVEGFGGVRVRRVRADESVAFAIGEDGELFSWGTGDGQLLGHGDTQNQLSPKRVEALRDVRVRSVAVGKWHVLALAEDGIVHAWGENSHRAVLGNPHVERELLPTPVEALRGVRVGSIAADGNRSYAVADTGELWAWGVHSLGYSTPLGHGGRRDCPLPKPIESLRGVKVDAVAANAYHTLARADDGSVYVWGNKDAAQAGVLGVYSSKKKDMKRDAALRRPQRVPGLRVACGL